MGGDANDEVIMPLVAEDDVDDEVEEVRQEAGKEGQDVDEEANCGDKGDDGAAYCRGVSVTEVAAPLRPSAVGQAASMRYAGFSNRSRSWSLDKLFSLSAPAPPPPPLLPPILPSSSSSTCNHATAVAATHAT